MAKINQVGPGRKTTGTIDGVTYVTTRNGNTYARIQGKLPAYVFKNPAALKRQCIFKMVQEHANYHLRTLKKTISRVGNGNVVNRYTQLNYKHLAAALDALADRMLEGTVVTLTEIEAAIAAYATEHTEAITIAAKNGYGKVYLTGAWPDTITLRASGGDSTVIIIVAQNGTTTTITPGEGGSTTVVSGGGSSTGSETPTVAAPVISGTTPFAESTSATISCATAGASIHYTVDGSTPTSASTAYTEALTITDTTTVKAVAVKDGVSSSVTTKTFTKSSGGDGPEGE